MNLYGNTTTEFVRRGQSGESPLHSSMANQFRCDGADPPFSPVAPSSRSMTPSSTGCPPSAHLLPAISLQDVERAHIIRVLAETHGIIEGPRGAARILGLHPNTLRFRLQKLGIKNSRRPF
jgi:transcriptional regulator with GAF, ATPase, and Fis domain